MKKHSIDYLLLFLLAIIWSGSFVLIKIGVAEVGPVTLTAARMTIGALVLLLCLAVTKTRLPLNRRALFLYLVVGVMGNTMPFILISWGEIYIDSSLAAMLMGIMPITTFVLAHYFIPSEPLTTRKVFGLCLGFGGLILMLGGATVVGVASANVLGQILVLLAAMSYGVTTVFVRTQPTFPGIQMATGAVLAGALIGLPLAFLLESPLSMTPEPIHIYAIFLLGIFPTALAALIYFRVLGNLGAMTFSQLNYAIPILGGLWGVMFLGEVLQLRMLIALAAVLAGIYFVRTRVTVTDAK